MSADERAPVALLVLAQTQFEHWDELPQLRAEVAALVQALSQPGSGYVLHPASLPVGGSKRQVEDALEAFTRERSIHDCLFVYWTGHGAGDTNHYLITEESPRREFSSLNAIRADVLGEIVARSRAEKVVVLIDTCYSSEGARAIADEVSRILGRRTYSGGQTPFFAVIPSAHSAQKAEAGVFCRTLLDVLTGANDGIRKWTDLDRVITVSALRDVLLRNMRAAMGDRWQPPLPSLWGYDDEFLPNPRFRRQPAMDVESRRRQTVVPEALQVAALGIDAGEAGRYFTPRRVISDVIGWLEQPGPGLSVVTGSPGSGKSAVLGHIVLLSVMPANDAGAAASVAGEMAPGLVSVAIDTRGKTAASCAADIASQFASFQRADSQIGAGGNGAARPAGPNTQTPVVVLDAVDESAEPLEVAELAANLAHTRGARVLVGARKSLDGRVLPAGLDRHTFLRVPFGPDAVIVDLDDDRHASDDIASYVRTRLLDSPHRDDPAAIAIAAGRVADAAAGSFLYARVVSRTLQSAASLDGPLPANQIDAFTTDLHSRFPDRLPLIDKALAALAWSRGQGVTRDAWVTIANAVSPDTPALNADDVSWVLDHLGWHILEAQEADYAAYRLIHQSFADYFRARATEPAPVERRIATALADGYRDAAWLNAEPYRRRHLVEHAASGGALDALVTQAGFLAVVEPTFLLPVLDRVTTPEALRFVTVYRWALNLSRAMPKANRSAILALAAHQQDAELAPRLQPSLPTAWQTRWAHWRRSVPSTTVGILDAAADAAVLATDARGEPIVICASGNTLQAIGLAAPLAAAWSRQLECQSITAVAFLAAGGASYVVAADDAGYLHLANLSTPDVIRIQAHARRVRGLAVLASHEPALVATCGDDEDIALWSLPELAAVARRQKVMQPMAVAFVTIDDRPALLVSGDTYSDEPLPPAAAWSVPDLTHLANYEVPSLIGSLYGVTLGGRSIALGSRFDTLAAWPLSSGAPVRLEKHADAEAGADAFLPLSIDDNRATILTNTRGGQLQRLVVTSTDAGVSIQVSPWIETRAGRWLGPIAIWGRGFLVSVSLDVRLWDVADVMTAVDTAPATSRELRDRQEDYGVLSIAGAADCVWFGVDSGHLLTADLATGRETCRLELAGGRPASLWSGSIDGEAWLLVGSYGGVVHCLDPLTGSPRRPPIEIGGPVTSLAVSQNPDDRYLAVTTQSDIDGRREYHVRLWRLPSWQEIDTRQSGRDARLRAFGAEPHWLLSVDSYEREKPLNAVAFLSSRDGLLVAAAGDARHVPVFDVATLEYVVRCALPTVDRSTPNAVSLTELVSDRDLMLVAGTDAGTIVAWELTDGRELWSRGGHRGQTQVAAVQWKGGAALASGGREGILRLWSADGAPLEDIQLGAAIWSIAPLEDGGIAVGCNMGLVLLDSAAPKRWRPLARQQSN